MQSKLTLRIDATLIHKAKLYAERNGKSLSQVVADFFALLNNKSIAESEEIMPTTRSLRGVIKGADLSEEDYKKHLEDKHS